MAPGPYPLCLTEADLSTLWDGQRFPASALVTRVGAPVRVLHPGRAGRGPGPDFRDAMLAVPGDGASPPGGVLRGDVELHVRASDFRAHGHERDHRYDRVILHVVFEDDADEETLLACGRRIAVVALAPWVRRRAGELNAWLSAPRLWREPCHDAIGRLGPEAVLNLLDDLGAQRFRERVSVLAEQVERLGPGEALFRALLAGLGYGGNTTLMALISERISLRALSEQIETRPDSHAVEALLVTSAGSLLKGHSGRPANHPTRRIKGLATLLMRHRALFAEAPDVSALLTLSARDLVAGFTVGSLIGRSRAIELLTNAALPWTAALASSQGRPDLVASALARYAALPRPSRYGALGFLETNLRNGDKPLLALTAQRQQGLLTLYKSECTQGGCGRCQLS